MSSKTSFFSGGLFRKNLLRFWPVYASYFILMLLTFTVPLFHSVNYASSHRFTQAITYIAANVTDFGLILSAIFGILSAMAVYGYLYNSKSCDFFHALPTTRTSLFVSNYLAGLCFLLVPLLLTFLSTMGVLMAQNLSSVLPALLQWLAMLSIQVFFFFSLATLCAYMTAHPVVLPVLYVVLNFTAMVVGMILSGVLHVFVYGFASDVDFTPFSPVAHILYMYNHFDSFLGATVPEDNPWPYFIGLLLVGLAFSVLAFVLHNRKRLECAGDVVAVAPLKPVFKYCFALGCALILGMMLNAILFAGFPEQIFTLVACMVVSGLIGYFAAEMLLRKSFAVFSKRCLLGAGTLSVTVLALCGALSADLFGLERYLPDSDEISDIRVYSYGLSYNTNDAAEIAQLLALHELILDNKDYQQDFVEHYYSDSYTSAEVTDVRYLQLTYYLKDGSVVRRNYDLPVTEQLLADSGSPISTTLAFFNEPERVLSRYIPAEPPYTAEASLNYSYDYNEPTFEVPLTAVQTEQLLEAITVDIMEHGLGKTVYDYSQSGVLYDPEPEMKEEYRLELRFIISTDEEGHPIDMGDQPFEAATAEHDYYVDHSTFTLDPSWVNTWAYLESQGVLLEIDQLKPQ